MEETLELAPTLVRKRQTEETLPKLQPWAGFPQRSNPSDVQEMYGGGLRLPHVL